jgi:hypothetical protein
MHPKQDQQPVEEPLDPRHHLHLLALHHRKG